jgi:hypothetical protein
MRAWHCDELRIEGSDDRAEISLMLVALDQSRELPLDLTLCQLRFSDAFRLPALAPGR